MTGKRRFTTSLLVSLLRLPALAGCKSKAEKQAIVRTILEKRRNEVSLCDAAVSQASLALREAMKQMQVSSAPLPTEQIASLQGRAKRLCQPFSEALQRDCEAAGVSDKVLTQGVRDEWSKQNQQSPAAQRARVLLILDQSRTVGCVANKAGKTVSPGLEAVLAGKTSSSNPFENVCIQSALGLLSQIEEAGVADRAFAANVWEEGMREYVAWPTPSRSASIPGGVASGFGPSFRPVAPEAPAPRTAPR